MARPHTTPRAHRTQPPPTPEKVEPIWLVKAIAATIGVATICGYLALCLLFYQGQWQLVLHPTRTPGAPSSIGGAPYQLLHFGPDESATPQLTGWWIPSSPSDRYKAITILFLPSGDGSLANAIPTLSALHQLGLNIFAFDYRGYGQSAETHPNQQKMIQDVDSAWRYLTTSRDISANRIIPYGIGVGASLAAGLAAIHPAIPALILDSSYTDLLDAARRDSRSSLIPTGLLFHEDFPLAAPLETLQTPKLLLSATTAPAAYNTARDPKTVVESASSTDPLYRQAVSRFLDRYLQLVPSPAPISK